MPKLQNILKRRPEPQELDPESRARLVKRLRSLRAPGEDPDDELGDALDPSIAVGDHTGAGDAAEAVAEDDPAALRLPHVMYGSAEIAESATPPVESGLVTVLDESWDEPVDAEAAPDLESVDAEPTAAEPEPIAAIAEPEPKTGADGPRDLVAVGPGIPESAGAMILVPGNSDAAAVDAVATPRASHVEDVAAVVVSAPPPARPQPARTRHARPKPAPLRPARPAARAPQPARPAKPAGHGRPARAARVVASCPYCAEPLPTPPVASGRCPRCRQRIVVRRVGDRAVLLTEAALPVFLAERKRAAHFGPWTHSRNRWLELAMASGAAPDRITRLTREPLSEDVIKRARGLYISTVEQTARTARRDRRWDEAGRLAGELAQTLYRIARSPKPVPDDMLAIHREGLASTLKGIAEVAREAELRAASCCDACRGDDGRIVRIATELRAPSLPHATCPKGLCRCRWYLAERDRSIVSGLLRRQARPPRPKAGT